METYWYYRSVFGWNKCENAEHAVIMSMFNVKVMLLTEREANGLNFF